MNRDLTRFLMNFYGDIITAPYKVLSFCCCFFACFFFVFLLFQIKSVSGESCLTLSLVSYSYAIFLAHVVLKPVASEALWTRRVEEGYGAHVAFIFFLFFLVIQYHQ